jgi:DNA-binding beta-propeller fold protein YncE
LLHGYRRRGHRQTAVAALLVLAALVAGLSVASAATLEKTWGSYGSGDGQFAGPHGMAIEQDTRNVYVVDRGNDRIEKFDPHGNFLRKWGYYGDTPGAFDRPYGIATHGGYVYVADTGNNRIQKFDSNGNYVRQWGGLGSGDGQLNYPRDVATDHEGNVYVADTDNNRIQKFGPHGNFIAKWGGPGAGGGNGQFTRPFGLATDWSHHVYVADSGNNRIQKFHLNGTFVGSWAVNSPRSVAVNHYDLYSHERVYVAAGTAIQVFRASGEPVESWTQPSLPIYLPNAVVASPTRFGEPVYVDESHRVVKIQP